MDVPEMSENEVDQAVETWTTGRAAQEIGHGMGRRQVQRLVNRGIIRGAQDHSGSWTRIDPTSAREYRASLERQLRGDP